MSKSKSFWNLLKAAPALLGTSLLVAQGSMAAQTTQATANQSANLPSTDKLVAQAIPSAQKDPIRSAEEYRRAIQRIGRGKEINDGTNVDSMSQITSVSELRDVSPTDWAYEALRSLVERYGCIVGYPNSTYRGDKSLSRWEFAAGLNACMDAVLRAAASKEDVEKLQRLAKEFEAELAALGARVDNLDARVSFLEDHQFTTTTKLKGEVVFSIADSWGVRAGDNVPGTGPAAPGNNTTQVAFNDRVRLNFETSFTGKDVLKTRLQAGNFATTFRGPTTTGTNMTRLAYDDGRNNDFTIDDFFYRFPIGKETTVWVGANALDLDDVFYTLNPYMESSGTGSLSRLERYNQFSNRGPSGVGTAVRYNFDKNLALTGTYLAVSGVAANPNPGSGLFNGSFSAGAQLYYKPMDDLDLAFTYRYSYRSRNSGGIFGDVSGQDSETPYGRGVANNANLFSLNANWMITEGINFTAWGGYGFANAQTAPAQRANLNPNLFLGTVNLWTWNAGVNFVDLGKEGAVLSLGGGMPPKGNAEGTSYMLQTQYKYPINKNILLTPGFYVVFDANNNARNQPVWMGVIRTTFTF
jgi:hypothetical protein